MGSTAKSYQERQSESPIRGRQIFPDRVFNLIPRPLHPINVINRVFFGMVLTLLTAVTSSSQKADGPARKPSNPVGFLSVPFQSNFDFGIRPNNGFRWTMNLQPIIPFSLNRNWNLINRISLPVIFQDRIFGKTSQTGIGDAVLNVLFSPKKSGIIWGAGPAFYFPTGSSDYLTPKKWGIGPTALAIALRGRLTLGVLYFHIWSFAGSVKRPELSFSYLQPFMNCAFKGGWGIGLISEMIDEMKSGTTNGALILTGSKLIRAGGRLINCILGPKIYFGNFNKPDYGLRASFVLLFPG
jgi:hypothetical protein